MAVAESSKLWSGALFIVLVAFLAVEKKMYGRLGLMADDDLGTLVVVFSPSSGRLQS